MPFPFILPTTSAFAFSSCLESASHPSLPLNASTYRGIVRDALKKHKRLPPASQTANLTTVVAAIHAYLPYLFAISHGLNDVRVSGENVHVNSKGPAEIEWRPVLTGFVVPGKEPARIKITSVEQELQFVLATLGYCYTLTARTVLQPLHTTQGEFLTPEQRASAVGTASRHLLDATSIYEFLSQRGDSDASHVRSCPDTSPTAMKAMQALAHAEATLLAVLKDDPYPGIVAQGRNKEDKEWMFKAPSIPKVRAHLYARLCLAASEHAAQAASLNASIGGGGGTKVNPGLQKYVEDMRRTSRAKACRFFGIDAELGGETAEGIGWLRAGLSELGVEVKDTKKGGLGFSKLRKDLSEKREDRKVDKESSWGADAGKMEETRILEMLETKWSKINDTMNTRPIPPANALLAKMPSGRDMHKITPYASPALDVVNLELMRAPPEKEDDYGNGLSSDEDQPGRNTGLVGAFPGTSEDYSRSTTATSHTYY